MTLPTRPNETELQGGISRGLAWVGLASGLVGVLDVIAYGLIIALWIPQEEFGVAALAFTLFPVLDLATDMGIAAAVIQRDDHTADKLSTLFWLNIAVSIVLFAALAFGIGPLLAWLHDAPILIGLFTLYGAKPIWQNVYFIPMALMKRELRFKELSLIRIVANFAEFVGKVGFAATGFGAWCFVAGPLCRVAVTGVGVQLCNPWRPRFVLRVREAMDWFSYGLKTSAHKMLYHLYTNIDYQIVGYFFGSTANALYTLAFKVVLEPVYVLSVIVVNVAFPTFARLKYEKDRLFDQLIHFTRLNLVVTIGFLSVVSVCSYEILLLFSGDSVDLGVLALRSDPVVRDVLSFASRDRSEFLDLSLLALITDPASARVFSPSSYVPYTAAVPVVRILCVVAVLRALAIVLRPFLDGVGRPTLALVYTAIASIVLPSIFTLSAVILGDVVGYQSVAIGWVVGYPIAFAVLLLLSLDVLKVGVGRYVARVGGIILCGAAIVPLGFALRWSVSSLPAAVRFGMVTAVMVPLFLLLLARFQGISPSAALRALRSK